MSSFNLSDANKRTTSPRSYLKKQLMAKTEIYRHLFSKADKIDIKSKRDTSQDRSERQVLLFLATTVFHIFRETGASKGLSDQVTAFHISRLVTKIHKGLPVFTGQVPQINKSKTLAKVVVKELQKKYAGSVAAMLLESTPHVGDAIVLCLQKHAKQYLGENIFWSEWSLVIVALVTYLGIFVFAILSMFVIF